MEPSWPRTVAISITWLTLLAGLTAGVWLADASALIANTLEDGAFYVQIARNIVLGRGITFDGQTPTTGVHWAWQFILTGAFFLAPRAWLAEPITVLRVAAGAYLAVLVFAGLVLAAAIRPAFPGSRWQSQAVGVLFVILGFQHEFWLMESHVVFLALTFVLGTLTARRQGVWGILAAVAAGWLLVFTRLDLIIILALLAGLEIFRELAGLRRVSMLVDLARFAATDRLPVLAGGLLGAVTVGLINLAIDGKPVSVSSAIKAGGGLNEPQYIGAVLWPLLSYYPADFLLTLAVSVGWVAYTWRPGRARSTDSSVVERLESLAVHAFLAAGAYSFLHLLVNHGVDGWYLAPLRLTAYVLTAVAIGRLLVGRLSGITNAAWPGRRGLVGVLPALALASSLHLAARMQQERHWTYERLVPDITTLVPPGERVYMEDLSGRLALLTDRDFVSGDGLVNSHSYLQEYLLPGQVEEYLADNAIAFFLSSNVSCDGRRAPWTRDVELLEEEDHPKVRFVIDISYLTSLPQTPSILTFPSEGVLLDRCDDGLRHVLVRTDIRPS